MEKFLNKSLDELIADYRKLHKNYYQNNKSSLIRERATRTYNKIIKIQRTMFKSSDNWIFKF